MISWLRRRFDPDAPSAKVGLRHAGVVAVLVFAAGGATGAWWSAAWGSLAAFVAVASISLHTVRGFASARQEMRDLWGLSGVILEQRPWPAPGGWGLGADALSYLLRTIPDRKAFLVLELGPGTSSVVLGRCLPGVRLIGFEHD
jgi:hypothetical protein